MKGLLLILLCLAGCVSTTVPMPDEFKYAPVTAGDFEVLTYQHITDASAPVHIYIEGDGNSFDMHGRPTDDPTPTGTLVRDLVVRDAAPNVVYIARPCQYIMSSQCKRTHWTNGRFAQNVVDSMATAVRTVAQNRPVVLIGYSGGAMMSGLIILQNPDIKVQKWITVAGVLNHSDWTEYFGDVPLDASVDMDKLPTVPQMHYVAHGDRVVPNSLSRGWVGANNLTFVPNATHSNMPELKINF